MRTAIALNLHAGYIVQEPWFDLCSTKEESKAIEVSEWLSGCGIKNEPKIKLKASKIENWIINVNMA